MFNTYLGTVRRSSFTAVGAEGVARRRFFGMFALQMALQGGQAGQHLEAEIAHIGGGMQTKSYSRGQWGTHNSRHVLPNVARRDRRYNKYPSA